ncbi:hypothetical protein [Corynebacterium glyciniphilum]|uniref:hypothetical protein n=1 Tax=Corynebacterium glyciniphilum TaxID=1404244 RepID=UPI002653FDA3|nr:hypothetical protein [Corynebacterium glyciniphilum]MDN6706760.1 hypothetical protein [Corynebacterium glyciniphilum]
MPILPAHGGRLLLAATTVALTAGLSTGVSSAESVTTNASGSSPISSSWVDSKRAISDIFSCKYQPNLPWCRKR